MRFKDVLGIRSRRVGMPNLRLGNSFCCLTSPKEKPSVYKLGQKTGKPSSGGVTSETWEVNYS